MPVTPEQAHMLASLAVACRPHGAPRWDEPGVVAAIRKVAHLYLADVIRAAINAAEDRDLQTPGAIGNPQAPCWRDWVPMRETPTPPKVADACTVCGRHVDACLCGVPSKRPARADACPPTEGFKAARDAIRGGVDGPA